MHVGEFLIRYVLGLTVLPGFMYLGVSLMSTDMALAWIAFAPELLVLYLLGEWIWGTLLSRFEGEEIPLDEFSFWRLGTLLLLLLPAVVVMFIAGTAAQR